MDEVSVKESGSSIESRIAHGSVPPSSLTIAGKLVTFKELMHCGLQHPLMSVIVYQNEFAVTVVPKAKHYVNQRLTYYFLGNHVCTGHGQMMVRMTAVVDGRHCQRNLAILFCGIAAHGLANLGDHESIKPAWAVDSVVLGSTDGNQDNVVFAALFDYNVPGSILDVAAHLAKLRLRRNAVFLQNFVNFQWRPPKSAALAALQGNCQIEYGIIG